MIDKKTKMFFKLLKKQEKVFEKIFPKESCDAKTQQNVALCLTELHFRSQHIVRLIKKISETNLKFAENDLDSLLGNLVDIRIEIYDSIINWIKELKKPLNTVIDNVEDLGDEKHGSGIARKTIRSSMKQIDINLKKMRYYKSPNNQKRKNKN